jgi:hypothetical protein
MCGACATAVSDWATPLVSGPRRRAALGRFVTSVCRGMVVGPVGSGWTAATMTGATRVARTLDALLDHVGGRLACDSWSELEAALVPHEQHDGDGTVPPYDDLEAVHRRAPLRLLAAHGQILGAAPAGPTPSQV